MKRKIFTCLILSMLMSLSVFANDNISIEGESKIKKADENININPYNIANITGVGAENTYKIISSPDIIDIPLKSPLYKISDYYRDRIVCKNGTWGVERNVTVKVFDGSEDWKLLDNYKYQNNNTTIFTYENNEKVNIVNGLCTHFDVFTDEEQIYNIYDGISFGEDLKSINIRIMNVRNVKDIETLKGYLLWQYNLGQPVTFYYISPQTKFEPFDNSIQEKLNQIDIEKSGYTDSIVQTIQDINTFEIDNNIFNNSLSNNIVMNRFMYAISDIKIYNSDIDKKYHIEGLYPSDEGFGLKILDNNGLEFTNEIIYKDINFISEKPTEIVAENENSDILIKLQINFSKIQIPSETIKGFKYEDTGISNNCFASKEVILPNYIPVVEGIEGDLYFKNIILNGNIKITDSVITNSNDDRTSIFDTNIHFIPNKNMEYSEIQLKLENGDTNRTEFIPVSKEAGNGREKTILFMGDSILNQDYYTDIFTDLFKNDVMKVKLIGTRGKEEAPNEGRGGWAAYDYCNTESKYGFTNPFLNNGKFDFSYYMNTNNFEKTDYVIINLGINDLNLSEHNSHNEIIKNLNTIFESIHKYDQNIKILLNTPTMLFSKEETNTAKNTRLNFIKTLKLTYENKENENIYLIPTYVNVNPDLDFKFTIDRDINYDWSMIVTDTSHPAISGYRKLAESTYSFVKYIEAQN